MGGPQLLRARPYEIRRVSTFGACEGVKPFGIIMLPSGWEKIEFRGKRKKIDAAIRLRNTRLFVGREKRREVRGDRGKGNQYLPSF